MNSHYIPRLLLKHFASKDKVNTYSFIEKKFETKKCKNTFTEKDLFDEELEKAFASRIEGPFGDLLNHKLLCGESIPVTRKENMLMRKFFMLNNMRAPIMKHSWDEMIQLTKLQEHASVQCHEFLRKLVPQYGEAFEQFMPSPNEYLPNLRKIMETEDLEKLANEGDEEEAVSFMARHSLVATCAVWDCSGTGMEFILPKLPGISQMDYRGIFYKTSVLMELLESVQGTDKPDMVEQNIQQLMGGSILYSDNFSIYPISPTRVLVYFSPYFKAFFPMRDMLGRYVYKPLLEREQFDKHFFEPARMELFEPCDNRFNQYYVYHVKQLTAQETMEINSLLLDMETDEFVFRDFNKIRDSFWYYDHVVKFAMPKKHDFHRLE